MQQGLSAPESGELPANGHGVSSRPASTSNKHTRTAMFILNELYLDLTLRLISFPSSGLLPAAQLKNSDRKFG